MNTAVLPPPAASGFDLSTYRLSFSLSATITLAVQWSRWWGGPSDPFDVLVWASTCRLLGVRPFTPLQLSHRVLHQPCQIRRGVLNMDVTEIEHMHGIVSQQCAHSEIAAR